MRSFFESAYSISYAAASTSSRLGWSDAPLTRSIRRRHGVDGASFEALKGLDPFARLEREGPVVSGRFIRRRNALADSIRASLQLTPGEMRAYALEIAFDGDGGAAFYAFGLCVLGERDAGELPEEQTISRFALMARCDGAAPAHARLLAERAWEALRILEQERLPATELPCHLRAAMRAVVEGCWPSTREIGAAARALLYWWGEEALGEFIDKVWAEIRS